MFGPYRTRPDNTRQLAARPHEEIVLGWALVVIGGVRVVLAIAGAESWGTEATLAGLMMPAGIHLLARR